jgi:hypothetical protein
MSQDLGNIRFPLNDADPKPVFWICDVFIRITHPYHWITDMALFFSGFQDAKKKAFSPKVFC